MRFVLNLVLKIYTTCSTRRKTNGGCRDLRSAPGLKLCLSGAGSSNRFRPCPGARPAVYSR